MAKKSKRQSYKMMVEEAILANPSLVKAILDSSKNMGPPMSADEMIDWIKNRSRK